jgi:hypothetical protein
VPNPEVAEQRKSGPKATLQFNSNDRGSGRHQYWL